MQGPAIINWLSNNCNLIGFNDCFDASANYQLLCVPWSFFWVFSTLCDSSCFFTGALLRFLAQTAY